MTKVRINYKCKCGKTLRLMSRNVFRDEIDLVFEPCQCISAGLVNNNERENKNPFPTDEKLPADFRLAEWGKCSECEELPPLKRELHNANTKIKRYKERYGDL